ncbi:MAG: peptidoglycan-binding protein [Pseudomonadota bacterium]
MRETSGAMREIAEALVSLRDDMRRDVDEIKTMTGSNAMAGDVRDELSRLSAQIESFESTRMGEQGRSEEETSVLQAELDGLRLLVNDLAREESMQRLENRWDGFEERISDLDPSAVREELITLAYRLDDIKSSIGQLPSALPLHQLEDKIKMLVAAIDAMARQPAAADPEIARQFQLLDERLNEISRAIVATSTAQESAVDREVVERLETRFDTLVERIGQIGKSNQTQIGQTHQAHNELTERMEALTRRVEELANEEAVSALAERLDMLTHTLTKQSVPDPVLVSQLDNLSRKVDSIDMEAVNMRLAEQLGQLSQRIDGITTDLSSTANNHDSLYQKFEELAERVESSAAQPPVVDLGPLEARLANIATRIDEQLSERIDGISTDLSATSSNHDSLYQRFEELAERVETNAAQPAVVDLGPLEMRLAKISSRIDEQLAPKDNEDEAIRALEEQVAGLSNLLSQSSQQPESASILEPRLAAIEDHLSTSHTDSQDLVIEAARQAAESAVASYQQNGASAADMSTFESLVEDLRSLEDLSRKSEERSARTIDAVHDTLLKIAGRLENIEETTAQQAQAQPLLHAAMDAPSAYELHDGDASAYEMHGDDDAHYQPAGHETAAYDEAAAYHQPVVHETAAYEEAPEEPVLYQPAADEVVSYESDEDSQTIYDAETYEPPALDTAESTYQLDDPDQADPYLSAEQTEFDPSAHDHQETEHDAFFAEQELPESDETQASGSIFSGLKQRFSGSATNEDDEAQSIEEVPDYEQMPTLEAEEEIDPETANIPLEPGSGAPDIKRIMAKVREAQKMASDDTDFASEAEQTRADKADFIAAARRAAQAAASEAADFDAANIEEETSRSSKKSKVSVRRKPILLAAGAILLAVVSYPLISGFIEDFGKSAKSVVADKPAVVEPIEQAVTEPVAETASETVAETVENTAARLPEVRVVETEKTAAIEPGLAADQATEAAAMPKVGAAKITQAPDAPQTLSADNGVQQTSTFQTNAPTEETRTASLTTEVPAEAMEIQMPPEAAGPLVLREAAANGDGLALFEIGARYTDGRGVPVDLQEAAKWYRLSADMGFAPAQYRLANFYEKGTGVDRDVSRALTWYQMAAEQGNASAMHNLAVLYAMGRDGVADYDSAARWFTRAADLGVKDSQFNLAILHARGSGVPQNLEESYKWFAIASRSGDKDASKKRDEVANALRPEQLESARASVELWKPGALVESANSVRIPPEWRGTETRTASVDMTKAIKNIQAILTKNGFDTGGIDGIMGNRTVEAIKAFQSSIGMAPTGEVSDALVKELMTRNY